MTPNPEQKNEQPEAADQIKNNADKLPNVKDETLAQTMAKKDIKSPDNKDIKNDS